MKTINTDEQSMLTKKQKRNLMLIGVILGFCSGLSFFVLKVMGHANNPNQLMVSRMHHE